MPKNRSRSRSKSHERRERHDDVFKRKSYESGKDSRGESDHYKSEIRNDRHRHEHRRSNSPRNRSEKVYDNNQPKNSTKEEDDEESRTIFVWQLSKRIRESDLRDFFSKAGPIKDVRLIKDQRTNRPKGIAYVEFCRAETVNKAIAFAGTRLLGVPIQINQVMDKPDMGDGASGLLDNDYADRGGVGLGNTGRLALMAKLAEGTGMELPKPALDMMKSSLGSQNYAVGDVVNMKRQLVSGYECFILSNMFENPSKSRTVYDSKFFQELKEDVEEECGRYGKVQQVFVDQRGSGGNVYVKCGTVDEATKCINVMNGRYFSGRIISASFITPSNFHQVVTLGSK